MTSETILAFYFAGSTLSALIFLTAITKRFLLTDVSADKSDRQFLQMVVFVIVAGRLPLWFFNFPLNEDEAVFLARASTLLVDPVWFRAIDTTSGGPITVYLLAIAFKLGLPISYFTCRVVATALLVALSMLFYKLLSQICSREVTQVFTILGASFWLMSINPDLLQFTSEMTSTLCIVGALLALVFCHVKERYPLRVLTAGALLIGLTPWAKLQASPIALVIAFLFLLRIALGRVGVFSILWTIGIMALPTVIVGVWSYQTGHFMDLCTRYFLTNFWLAQDRQSSPEFFQGGAFLALITNCSILPFFAAGFMFIWYSITSRATMRFDLISWAAGGVLSVTLYTLYVSGIAAPHYLTFLIYPLLLFLALLYRDFPKIKALVPVLLLPQLAGICMSLAMWKSIPIVVLEVQSNPISFHRPEMPELESVRALFGSDELAVSIWGWGARIFPALGAYQGNRDTTSVYLFPNISRVIREYHVAGFIDDLRRRKPQLFIDTSRYKALPSYFHTAPLRDCPELNDYLTINYAFWKSINGGIFYIRRDLMEKVQTSP